MNNERLCDHTLFMRSILVRGRSQKQSWMAPPQQNKSIDAPGESQVFLFLQIKRLQASWESLETVEKPHPELWGKVFGASRKWKRDSSCQTMKFRCLEQAHSSKRTRGFLSGQFSPKTMKTWKKMSSLCKDTFPSCRACCIAWKRNAWSGMNGEL